jgi:hypothetical protein
MTRPGFVRALIVAAFILTPTTAAAAPTAPFTECPSIGADTSCALLVYANSAGQLGIAGDPTQPPYFTEDTLVGVRNESSQPLSAIPLASTTGKSLFEFDEDGLCTVPNAPVGCPFGSTGYEGPGVSFTAIRADYKGGTVQFSPPIPPGGHSYFSLEEALSTVPPFDFQPGATYAALGDSYSAGEGNGPYGWGSDLSSHNHCDRSLTAAYGPLIDALAPLGTMTFVACSGAITDDMFDPNNEGNLDPAGSPEPAQLTALTSATQTVTLTIGGNDAGFAEVLGNCVQVALGPISFGNGDCLRDHSLAAVTEARINALGGKGSATTPQHKPIHSISSVLTAIHQAAPNAHVYIAGYPLLFPLTLRGGNCKVGTVIVKNASVFSGPHDAIIKLPDQVALDLAGLKLDDAISSAARSAGQWTTYVDPIARWDDHTFCASQSLWFHELFVEVDHQTSRATTASGSFHPNQGGQLSGYAEAFLEAGV